MKSSRRRLEVNLDELDQVLDGARESPLSEADYDKLKGALHALAAMLVQPRTTEKTSAVVEGLESHTNSGIAPDTKDPRTGYGRNSAAAFAGAQPRKRIRAEGAESAGSDCRTGAAGGHGVLAGAFALRRLRAGVHGTRARGYRSGKVRRDGGGNDRATEVR
jgi:hypothetical protein